MKIKLKKYQIKNLIYLILIIGIGYFVYNIVFDHHAVNNNYGSNSVIINNQNTVWLNQARPVFSQWLSIGNAIINDANNANYSQMNTDCHSLGSALALENNFSKPTLPAIAGPVSQAESEYQTALSNCTTGINDYFAAKNSGNAVTFNIAASDIVITTNALKSAANYLNQVLN